MAVCVAGGLAHTSDEVATKTTSAACAFLLMVTPCSKQERRTVRAVCGLNGFECARPSKRPKLQAVFQHKTGRPMPAGGERLRRSRCQAAGTFVSVFFAPRPKHGCALRIWRDKIVLRGVRIKRPRLLSNRLFFQGDRRSCASRLSSPTRTFPELDGGSRPEQGYRQCLDRAWPASAIADLKTPRT